MLKEIVKVKCDDTTVVIGAGPYGLSVAAHLKAQSLQTLVFGKTMELWKKMPPGLCLKSIWSASSIADPAGKYSIDHYIAATNTPRQEPIPLSLFLNYALWFQQQNAPDVDPVYVQSLAADGKSFHLDLADGRTVKASNVVVAAGISSFAYIPDFARDLPETVASHTSAHADLTGFKDRSVIVIGKGQSALEYAALLHEAGADVELITRGLVRWHSKLLYERTGPARHIFYPPGDVGPPGINWLVAFPSFYNRLPERIKGPVHKRAVLPGGAKWLRPRIEGQIRITESTHIVKATAQGRGLCLELSDGTEREIDYLFLGTGYQPDFRKLAFIDAALCQQLQEKNGYPVLNAGFESSVSHLYFAGLLAGHTFGPTCRFVSGTKGVARKIAHHLAKA
jgi:cation diffusion facilitator CzcD-associated flavoprotein CzcO